MMTVGGVTDINAFFPAFFASYYWTGTWEEQEEK
jgi:hypothetical protein